MRLFDKTALLFLLTILFVGCQESYLPVDTIPVMKTLPTVKYTATTAVLAGSIVKPALDSESSDIAPEYYFLLATNGGMDTPQFIAAKRSNDTMENNLCQAHVTGLIPATTYYYRLCVSNKYSLVEGEILSFSTSGNTITEVTANLVVDPSETTALLTGTFEAEMECRATFILSESSSFSSCKTIDATVVEDSCYVLVHDLKPGTTYYYKLSVHDSYSTVEGDVLSFTTRRKPYQSVNLGLSVKWATCNIGASDPEEYGNYYAWGEIGVKTVYSWDNYKHRRDSVFVDLGDDINGSSYDIAHIEWGEEWRMPTIEEVKELIDKCTWQWTVLNGVRGQLVTGPNGNSIFLPAAGGINNSDSVDVGSFGRYWTGTALDYADKACYLGFEEGFVGWNYNYRFYGRSVRPVTE